MKVLRLTTSGDSDTSAPVEDRAPALLARMLEEATGEPAEISARIIWPAHELPDILDRWLGRDRPDVVFLWVNPFWHCYASAPLKLERMGGRVGRLLGRAGRKASATPWVSRNRVFRFARRLALRAIGGAYYFEPEEVAEVVAACVRRINRHEDTVPIVYQSPRCSFFDPDPKSRTWSEERRQAVNVLLHQACRELHAICDAEDDYEPYGDGRNFVDGDGMHPNALAQAWIARDQFPPLLAAWKRLRQGQPVAATDG